MNQVIENSKTGCVADDKKSQLASAAKLVKYNEDIRAGAMNPTQPNMIGWILLSSTIASLSEVKNIVCEANARIAEYSN